MQYIIELRGGRLPILHMFRVLLECIKGHHVILAVRKKFIQPAKGRFLFRPQHTLLFVKLPRGPQLGLDLLKILLCCDRKQTLHLAVQHIRQLGAGFGRMNRLQLFHHRAKQQYLGKGITIVSGHAGFIVLPCPSAQFFKFGKMFLRHRFSLNTFNQLQSLCGGPGSNGVSQRALCQFLGHMMQVALLVQTGRIKSTFLCAGSGKPCQHGDRHLLNSGGHTRPLCGGSRQSLADKGGLDAELTHDAFSSTWNIFD